MTDSRLILVGAPAAGKTTVGRLLAERHGRSFIDTDEQLAQALGLSLPEAWASLPAARIAATETEICTALLELPGVVALGSRAVADPQLRTLLAARTVVWLRVSSVQLTRRLGMGSLGMATLAALRGQMDALLAEREPWYEEVATLTLDTDRRDAETVVELIEQVWEGTA